MAGGAGATGPTGATGTAGVDAATDGWVDDSVATWTRTANQTFTVTGDRTAVFTKGTRLRWTQTTAKYGVVVASSHAAGTTTVTIATNTDFVLTAAAISLNSYSYAANPQGYPGWFNYTPTEVGWSGSPSLFGAFSIVGTTCYVIFFGSGTSDTTGATLSAPVTCGATPFGHVGAVKITNNGAAAAAPGQSSIASGESVITILRDWVGVNFTASGTKTVQGELFYFI